MDLKLAGTTALITGGATGIGRATALAFATAGAKVVVADIDEGAGGETVQIIRDGGGDAIFVQADVSQSSDVANMAEALFLPYWFWGAVCGAISLAVLAFGLYLYLRPVKREAQGEVQT